MMIVSQESLQLKLFQLEFDDAELLERKPEEEFGGEGNKLSLIIMIIMNKTRSQFMTKN